MTRAMARLMLARADHLTRRSEKLAAIAEKIVTTVQHKHGAHFHLTERGGLVREPGLQGHCRSTACQAVAEAERASRTHPARGGMGDDGIGHGF